LLGFIQLCRFKILDHSDWLSFEITLMGMRFLNGLRRRTTLSETMFTESGNTIRVW